MKYAFHLLLVTCLLACSHKARVYKNGVEKVYLKPVQLHITQDKNDWVGSTFNHEKWIVPTAIASGLFAVSITGFNEISKLLGGAALGGLITWGGNTWLNSEDKDRAYEIDQCMDGKLFHQQYLNELQDILIEKEIVYINTDVQKEVTIDGDLKDLSSVFLNESALTPYQALVVFRLNFAREEKTGDPLPQLVYRLVIYENDTNEIIHDEKRIVSYANEYSYSWDLLLKNDCKLGQDLIYPLLIKATKDLCDTLGHPCRKKKLHTSKSQWGLL